MPKIIGNLEVTNNITSYGNNVVRSVNGNVAGTDGNIQLSFADIDASGYASPGNILIADSTSNLVPDDIVQYLRLCSNNQFDEEKTHIETWDTIFNTWKRFSHNTDDPSIYPAMESELSSWEYDSTSQDVKSTINSVTYLGFVSPSVYTRYNFEVQCISTDTDNDMNGVVIAYTEQDGRQYTLTAVRVVLPEGHTLSQPGATPWAIVYNYRQFDQRVIVQGTYAFTTTGGWNTYPSGVKIKVLRDGNIIQADTSDFADSTNAYISPLTVDLTTDPDLEKFIKPCACGYGNQSQNSSSFVTLQFSGTNTIYNYETNEIWYYNFGTSSWLLDTENTVKDFVKPGYVYSNLNTCDLYTYHVPSDEIRRIAGTLDGSSVSSLSAKSVSTEDLSENGYYTNSSGLLECWGKVSGVSSSSSVTVNLVPTYSEIYNIQCTVVLKDGLDSTCTVFASYNNNNSITISTASSTSLEVFYRVLGKS